MLIMTCSPLEFPTRNALHLVHGKELSNPRVNQAMELIETRTSHIAKVGEHTLSDPKFFSYETIVLHEASPANLFDYLNKLKRGNYLQRFHQLMFNKKQNLVVYRSAIQLLPAKLLIVQKTTDRGSYNPFGKLLVNAPTDGLGLLKYRFDIDFDPSDKKNNFSYLFKLQNLSNQEPIFLLDSSAMYCSDNTVRFGSVYMMHKRRLTRLSKMPELIKRTEKQKVQERELPSVEAMRAPQTVTEKETAEAGKAKMVVEDTVAKTK